MERRQFNMIEIVLALGVVGVGMIAILALFPIGLTASRNSIGHASGAMAADQLLHYISAAASANSTTWSAYMLGPSPAVPLARPSGTTEDLSAMAQVAPGVFRHSTARGRYSYVRFIDSDGDGMYTPGEIVDLRLCLRIWQEGVRVYRLDGTYRDIDRSTGFAKINCRVEWPEEAPAARRTADTYVLEACRD